jgi:uncharacterized protein YjbI with pentapeptide repeats
LANQKQLALLEKGVNVWNKWRKENPTIEPDLTGADLSGKDLSEANLSKTNLFGAELMTVNLNNSDLSYANLFGAKLNAANLHNAYLPAANLRMAKLIEADLSGANLFGALLMEANLNFSNLIGANLTRAKFSNAELSNVDLTKAKLSLAYLSRVSLRKAKLVGADLSNADLSSADLSGADLSNANLTGAELSEANLSEVNLSGADMSRTKIIGVTLKGATLTDCRVFGISAWGVKGLEGAEQSNLIITPEIEPIITVDNLEVAQFIYLMLYSEKIRHVIDTITSKVVLILGRFTSERKAILDAIREELRKQDYLPILFDFDKPASRDLTETVLTLAGLARFVIADITDATSVPQELTVIVHNLPSVPVQPIILSPNNEYCMFEHFKKYPWVLKAHRYTDKEDLLKSLIKKVIAPAENKAIKLQKINSCLPLKKRKKQASEQR